MLVDLAELPTRCRLCSPISPFRGCFGSFSRFCCSWISRVKLNSLLRLVTKRIKRDAISRLARDATPTLAPNREGEEGRDGGRTQILMNVEKIGWACFKLPLSTVVASQHTAGIDLGVCPCNRRFSKKKKSLPLVRLSASRAVRKIDRDTLHD